MKLAIFKYIFYIYINKKKTLYIETKFTSCSGKNVFQIPIVNYQQLLDFNLIQTKIKSDPRTNTEEQINIKHIEFTFCNLHYLHYVKCNKLWNFYAGFFFHCFCWIGFSRQRAEQELKLDETYVPDYISWQSNDFFPLFSSKMRRSVTDKKTCETSASILSNAMRYIYIKYIRR